MKQGIGESQDILLRIGFVGSFHCRDERKQLRLIEISIQEFWTSAFQKMQRTGFAFICFLVMTVNTTYPVQVLPLPNIPFFWLLFRAFANWRALKVPPPSRLICFLYLLPLCSSPVVGLIGTVLDVFFLCY